MRIFVLFLVLLLSFNAAFARNPFKKTPPVLTTPAQSQIPIDEEFQTEFVGYDEKEAKAFEKEQKALQKLEKKRKKLEAKKIKLEQKRAKSIENCERSQEYIEQLNTTDEVQSVEENL